MSQWFALYVIVGCLVALLVFWLLRNYTAPWLTCVSRIAVAALFGWLALRTFVDGWEDGKLRAGCRRGISCGYILIDSNPIEFVLKMALFAGIFAVALGCLLYHAWWLILILRARLK